MGTQHLFKFLAQVTGNQMKRLLKHGAPFDGEDGLALFQAPMELFKKGALPRAHRAHQINDLSALFAL